MAKRSSKARAHHKKAPANVSTRKTATEGASSPRKRLSRTVPWGWLIFAVALAMRLLFWQAAPDAGSSHSAFYKGDAPIWVEYARALQQDVPFELGLPLRPPGNGYLLAAVWDGQAGHLGRVKLLWCLLGAATASLFYAAARRQVGVPAACVVGFGMALGQGFLVLSTSLNNETPYMFLVGCLFLLWNTLRDNPALWRLALWGGLNAAACLFRAEHLLFVVLCLGALVWRWFRDGAEPRRVLVTAAKVAVPFALVLLPWHLQAWEACRDFNRVEPSVNAATERAYQQVEQALAGMEWHDDALAQKERLPAATRRAMANFVAATVFVRGGREVTADDFDVLEEAFGAHPFPLSEHPLVALYGGLNFYLANNPEASPGFDRGPLDAPPPLTGGLQRYPSPLVAGLPPPQLALTYPPHLDIVNSGYGKGLDWIGSDPGGFAAHVWSKTQIFWDGAALGLGGHNLPFGGSGVRRKVDVVVPSPCIGTASWQLGWLAVLCLGIWRGIVRWRRHGSDGMFLALPWMAWAVLKIVVTVAFFGYARQGITAAPLLFLLLGLCIQDLTASLPEVWHRRGAMLGALAVGGLLLLEILRWAQPPLLILDGRPVGESDPWPTQVHEERSLEVRPRDALQTP